MSRRWSDMSRPAPHVTTGESIGVGLGLLAGVIVLIIVGFVMATLISVKPAKARDVGQWEDSSPLIHYWFKSLMQPDNPGISCCGKADAYWADRIEFKDGKIFAIITDERPDEPLGRPHVAPGTPIEVPPHKMNKDPNPTGHNVVFLSPSGYTLCFVAGTGV